MQKIYILTKEGIIEEQKTDAARQIATNKHGLFWVDLRQFSDEEVHTAAAELGLHSIAVDSIINSYTRPHLVEYEDHFHINFTLVSIPHEEDVKPSELHVFLFQDSIITMSEDGGGALIDQVLNMYRDTPAIVERGSYYALYLLSDLLADSYFPIVEGLDERVDSLEDEMLQHADENSLQKLLHLKRNLFDLRRFLGPQRDIFNELARRDFPFIKEKYQVYFQDIYNRMIRVFDVMDTSREIVTGALDIYQSTVSNRLNDIMKVLTIFATILGILTVITGFFGMNFVYMPGLSSRNAVVGVLVVMFAVAAGMLYWFRRKKWL